MPVKDKETTVTVMPTPKRGVNLFSNLLDLHEEEAILMKNLVYSSGLQGRGGSDKFVANEVVAGKRINGLHRFYYGTASKQVLAAAGTTVKYWDGAAWTDVKTGLTENAATSFSDWLVSCYIANGVDAPHKWSGAVNAAVAAAPAMTKMFLPYQDRLLSISGGDLSWSSSFTDATWETVANCNVRPDVVLNGMIIHADTNANSGYTAKVLLAGNNGMYLFAGRDLRVPYTTGDYSIYALATKFGCSAFRTMAWTPRGSIWYANDKQLYLLPFDSTTPIPIGHKIQSQTGVSEVDGIDKIPAALISRLSAVYHNGYYKLSCPSEGGVNNVRQWWLQIDRLYIDENRLAGPFFGPMEGMEIECFATMTGFGDNNDLIGGSANATTGGFIYNLSVVALRNDVGVAIDYKYRSSPNALGSHFLNKVIHRMEVETLDVDGTITCTLQDIADTASMVKAVTLSPTSYWGMDYWGVLYWDGGSDRYVRTVLTFSEHFNLRFLRLLLEFSSSSSLLTVIALRIEHTEQELILQR